MFKLLKKLLLLQILILFFGLSPVDYSYQDTQIETLTHKVLAQESPDDSLNETLKTMNKSGVTGVLSGVSRVEETTWAGVLYNVLTGFGSLFMYLGGWFFDVSLTLFVSEMANTVKWLGIDASIDAIWQLVRDIFNLIFIFALIMIGFKTILGSENDAKKSLANLVIAALLINFSLYITQIVVDFSNIAAQQVQALMRVDSKEQLLGKNIDNISGGFANKMNLENLNKNQMSSAQGVVKTEPGSSAKTISETTLVALGFMLMILYIILGFIFAAGAVFMFTRFIVLIVLMVFSPVMFLGFIYPQFDKYAKDWWQRLYQQALLAPAFLFCLYFSFTALDQLTVLSRQDASITSISIFFIIVAGFAIMSLKVAQSFSAYGATTAINWGHGLRKRAQSFAGANTIGRGSELLAKGYDRIASSKAMNSGAGKFARGVATTLTLGALSDRSVRTALKAGTETKFGGTDSRSSYKKDDEARDSELSKQRVSRTQGGVISAGASVIKENVNPSQWTVAQREAVESMEKELANTSNTRLTEMAKDSGGQEELKVLAGSLKQSQFEHIINDKEIDPGFRKSLIEARQKTVSQKVAAKGGLAKASKDELKSMPLEEVKKDAIYLKSDQINELDNIFGPYGADIIRQERNKRFEELAKKPVELKDLILKTEVAEIAKWPDGVLNHENFIKALLYDDSTKKKFTIELLKKISSEGKADTRKIGKNISDAGKNTLHYKLPTNIITWLNANKDSVPYRS